jgi:uncharacterized protein YciI
MFLVLLDYLAPTAEMDRHVDAHRAHLAEQYAAGRLLMSGPQVPRTGGVIVACLPTHAEVEAMMQRDPFVTAGVVRYRIIEFVARATHPVLAGFAETAAQA